MKRESAARRFLCALAAIATAALLLRPVLSDALTARGDELALRGFTPHALVLYQRAIWLDDRNGVALDRYLFTLLMTHRRANVLSAVMLADAYLRRMPTDADVLMDAAMGEELLRRDAAAERDFARLGTIRRDPRAYAFAGFAAMHAGRKDDARTLFARALALDVRFLPAARALARLR